MFDFSLEHASEQTTEPMELKSAPDVNSDETEIW